MEILDFRQWQDRRGDGGSDGDSSMVVARVQW